jgi:Protein of unknown function (DUF2786)
MPSATPDSGRKPARQGPPPTCKATVKELADHGRADRNGESMIDQQILDRIQKCLDRAKHPNTPELEAKAAWRMSSRLMAQYNVTHADLYQATKNEDLINFAGRSVVAITHTKSDFVKVLHQAWVSDIANAMTTFFDCKWYSTARAFSVEWTFYGIAANTVAAAQAFEMAHNLCLEWARTKNPKRSYCLGIGAGLKKMARDEKKAEKRQAKERERREQQEQQRERESEENNQPGADAGRPRAARVEEKDSDLEPLQETRFLSPSQDDVNSTIKSEERGKVTPAIKLEEDDDSDSAIKLEESGSHISEFKGGGDNASDDDHDDESEAKLTFKEEDEKPIDLDGDFEQQLQDMIPVPDAPTPSQISDDKNNALGQPERQAQNIEDANADCTTISYWKTSQALVLFQQSAKRVAEEYLKAQKVKLRANRKRVRTVQNYDVYLEGMEDSKKIDVKRRRIEGPSS